MVLDSSDIQTLVSLESKQTHAVSLFLLYTTILHYLHKLAMLSMSSIERSSKYDKLCIKSYSEHTYTVCNPVLSKC